MIMLNRLARPISKFLILTMFGLGLPLAPTQAAMVGTDAVIGKSQAQRDRDRIRAFLERQDVQQQMQSYGVDPAEAKARVESLSDQEIATIAGKLDQLPAGGDGAGAVVGALLLIFFVLLVTDLLGLTHVFPFVYHRR